MIRTRNGYIGLASHSAEVGDSVVFFQGGQIPLLIRKEDGQRRLTGDAYVHGVMQGEMWDESQCKMFLIN